jgi:osmotically inducible protein OsmC
VRLTGGTGGDANPEEQFAIGYTTWFEIALAAIARRCHQQASDVTIESTVSHRPTVGGAPRLVVTLDVALPSVGDRATAAQLVQAAYKVCLYCNATRGNIDVNLLIEGEPI